MKFFGFVKVPFKHVVYFMIYWICHCVTTQRRKRVVVNTMRRQKNARTRVHLCTIRRKLRTLLRTSSMFLKDAIRFCAPNRFVRRNVFRRAFRRICTHPQTSAKNKLVLAATERRCEREKERRRERSRKIR